MSLPRYFKQNESGQVLVIFLLVLVIGLALVLSIASRTVTDIRQTTTSDESNRAYFAAESGVEDALKKIESNSLSSTNYSVNLTSVNRTQANVTVGDITWEVGQEPLNFGDFAKDEVAQINLLGNFHELSSHSGGSHADAPKAIGTGETLTFHYGKTGSAVDISSPALEISVVSFDSGAWSMRKMTFDPFTGRDNGFCEVGPGSPATGYRFSVVVPLSNPNSACSSNAVNEAAAANPVIARVRFLYNSEKVPFGVTASKDLPKQGDRIESTGFTPSGVTRKLLVNRFYPALPAIFDYVLYNGSSGDLCKGGCP